MAIVRPEAIDDALALASRSAAKDGGRRLFCFAMQSRLRRRKIAGGRHCGIGDRGAAVLRPDQAIRGRVERTRPGQPWGDTWRRTACTNKATSHPVGQRPAKAHKRRCRPTRRKCQNAWLRPECGTTTLEQDLWQEPQPHQGAGRPKLTATLRSWSRAGRHTPSRAGPAAAATDRNRHARPDDAVHSRTPSTCVRDRARRGETATPVRAQPTSPARRETPNRFCRGSPPFGRLLRGKTAAEARFAFGSVPAARANRRVHG